MIGRISGSIRMEVVSAEQFRAMLKKTYGLNAELVEAIVGMIGRTEMPKKTAYINVFDAARNKWRGFLAEVGYVPRCGNGLHQVGPRSITCACGQVPSLRLLMEKHG